MKSKAIDVAAMTTPIPSALQRGPLPNLTLPHANQPSGDRKFPQTTAILTVKRRQA
jgi:hypothetical protein